jgi:hypothetical protein
LEDLDIDGEKILKWALKTVWEGEWINLAQDRDKWYPVLKTAKNLWVP